MMSYLSMAVDPAPSMPRMEYKYRPLIKFVSSLHNADGSRSICVSVTPESATTERAASVVHVFAESEYRRVVVDALPTSYK